MPKTIVLTVTTSYPVRFETGNNLFDADGFIIGTITHMTEGDE